jgi:DNA-binding beta-propeller fold protein YncE
LSTWPSRLGLWVTCLALGSLLALGAQHEPDAATAAPTAAEPIFVFSPIPPPLPGLPIPPPTGFLNGPCGMGVDSAGRFYVSDYHHDAVDVYDQNADYNAPGVLGATGYLGQLAGIDTLDGPCGLAFDGSGRLYVNDYHRGVVRYGAFGSFGGGTPIAGTTVDGTHPTGVAVDAATGRVYVDQRTYVGVYDSTGAPVEEDGEPLRIGLGSLGDGYGVAVSAFPGTAGQVYVPDGASNTVKIFDPAVDKVSPIAEIDAAAAPAGGFASLRDSAIAVDRVSGDIYVTDDLQPADTVSPRGLVEVFSAAGAYLGHLKYEIVVGTPPGLAVDNSEEPTQGRVYVTSGNTHLGGIYAYPPGAATEEDPLAGSIPPRPAGGDALFPALPIGGSTIGGSPEIACEGDACQILPVEPRDPTLTTQVSGLGNPRVRYRRYTRRHRHGGHRSHRKRHGKRSGRGHSAAASAAPPSGTAGPDPGAGAVAGSAKAQSGSLPGTAALPPLPAGFDAEVKSDGGGAATLAGSHPYALRLSLGLDQNPGSADLRQLRLEFPPGLLVNPAVGEICGAAAFALPRSSPFEASSSGESCPATSQVGTLEAEAGAGEVRRFGLFELRPPDGAAARFGAAPFGTPLVFDAHLLAGGDGSVSLALESSQVPQGLALHGLSLALWGVPWDATHDGERGNCLNEAEPAFPWAKCSVVGEPAISGPPLAFLTLPTTCGGPLAFAAEAEPWSGATVSAEVSNRNSGGQPALLEDCATLHFEPSVGAALSTKHVSSPSGFVLRLEQEDLGFANPRGRAQPRARVAVVELPRGVTLNPSLGAGLEGCTPAQLAATTLVAQGCRNGSKIGNLRLDLPFYKGELEGSVYLAQPGENPYGSLLAVYLVAKAADRGILIKARAELIPDPGDGTITAHFDGLTQLPYSELQLELRTGQRAAFVSPPSCGPAATRIELSSWADTDAPAVETESPLEAGIEGAPCPTGTPPFVPSVNAGGVNSNANSYTPYFMHLARSDSEQEITSYSLVLPAGITGKLAGIPFCPDAAIAAARTNRGFAEAANPSCPEQSRVGRTITGYGVGPSLAYSEGKVYLAGPYHGSPLSLVTINPATVGPFDVGTIVVRSAFDLDPLTAQLRIDSRSSDPIPHIVDGIVLHLRDIRVYLDRPEFTHNPTSCEPSQLVSTLTGSGASFESPGDDSIATTSAHFQLLNCRSLGFRPKLGLRLRGSSRRGGFPALRATFAARGAGDSNLKQIEVDLPHQLFLAQNHIRTICTRPQFAAERCPRGSVYGKAVAHTPLLDQPLRGDVLLRSSDGRLPDLVADLHSGSIRITVEGTIGSTGAGGVRTVFTALPDAPITRFTMLFRGGRRALFTNSVDVCRRPPLASVRALGQNNVGAVFTTLLRGQCKRSGHPHPKGRER